MFTLRQFFYFVFSLLLLNLSCDDNKDPVSNNDKPDPPDTTVTPVKGTLTDADGNVYKTLQIGTQTWTVEDLRTTTFNDSSAIPNITDSASWHNATSAAYCFYKNSTNSSQNKKYGALYNWYAVNTNKLAPKGWHVPTVSDWDKLRNYLIAHHYNYDDSTSGNKMAKSLAATSDWKSFGVTGTVGNDLSKNNTSGFNALPNGSRYSNQGSDFSNMGAHTHYWCTNSSYDLASSIYISYDSSSVSNHQHFKNEGFTIRLVKDN